MAKGCREGRPCGVDGCRQLHHKLLHPSPMTESARSSGSDSIHPSLWAVRSTSGKGLPTARACAYGPNGKHVVVNCLLDTGTAVSFIRKDSCHDKWWSGIFTMLQMLFKIDSLSDQGSELHDITQLLLTLNNRNESFGST
ncbi:hypothetical protein T05_9257 [Trichinella murrelli]|uniref:Uncharacterized protein n=1 Tax=Trichinella murrelli TaxID=144512 RepID=A0A0V0SZX7_9BILA|nr:hypothetical protein T05_9257 [Trichinella murrelli]